MLQSPVAPRYTPSMSLVRSTVFSSTLTLLLTALGGCSSAGTSTTEESVRLLVPAAKYAETFQAARDTLRLERFDLDRVDAPRGVLTSQPKDAPGIARPWDARTDSMWQDAAAHQLRSVRITFRQPGFTGDRGVDDPSVDLVEQPRDTEMLVQASVERVQRPGRRAQVDSVRMTSQATSPDLDARAMSPRYSVFTREDSRLAAMLRDKIAQAAGVP